MKSPERRGPRLELKFLLDAQRSAEIFQWARTRMDADPHARDPQHPIYTVESIYFDTPTLDCLRGSGPDRLPKYRARRYDGNGQSIFLEEKLRRQQQVWKRRLPCKQGEFLAIAHGADGLRGDPEWFRMRFQVLQLKPSLVIVYRRLALVAAGGERLTIDQVVEASRVGDGLSSFVDDGGTPAQGKPLRITELDVLELKHPPAHSTLMRELTEMAGEAEACSKYTRGMLAFGFRRNGTGSTAQEA